jgi:signal transduction histidine kinase
MIWFIRSAETEKRIGAALCALLAASGLAFPISELWDAEWWGWHLLRFAGGAAAAAYFGAVHLRLVRQTREALQARETFLDMAAHELRTPLVPLLMRAQIMERELARGGQVRPAEVKKLRRNVQFIVELIRGLFTATPHGIEGRTLKKEPLSVEALVGEVVETFQNTSEIHELRLETKTPALWFHGDGLYLRQVIVNLVHNAMKYSPDGGPIDVSIERSESTVSIAVRDRGVGIAPKDQARIFDKFYRAGNLERHAIAGLGLGLYISDDIVRAHGGRISVSSAPGQGATFTVTLPVIGAPPQAEGNESPS